MVCWYQQVWKFGRNNRFVTAMFLSLIKDNSFPQIHLYNTNVFFEGVTGKHFYNLAYKLHFLLTDYPTLHKRAGFSTTIQQIKSATVKFALSFWQPSSQDLSVNITHIRSKTFHCVRKYIKFVKVSFQVLIKRYMLKFKKYVKC